MGMRMDVYVGVVDVYILVVWSRILSLYFYIALRLTCSTSLNVSVKLNCLENGRCPYRGGTQLDSDCNGFSTALVCGG